MPSIQLSGQNLLDAVSRLEPGEFDAFIERALKLRNRPKEATLSARETKLIERINRGLPPSVVKRTAQLTRRRSKEILTAMEHDELLDLTRLAESRDADRAAALVELSKLRRIPLRTLMKQMGIKALPVNG